MRRLHIRNKSLENTGFDNRTGNSSSRLLNKDGSSNVVKEGIPFFQKYSTYHTLINMPFWMFMLFSLIAFIIANVIFAGYYYCLGYEALGLDPKSTPAFIFQESFFFSVQTITTVGYGHHYPHTLHANILSAFETLFGWMAFAVLTGLLYGRFSRPKAYLLFSKNALISPYKDGKALMFRMAPYKNTIITEAEVKINLSFMEMDGDKRVNRFYSLDVELDKISTLALNWTVVHAINENSPLLNFTAADFVDNQVEIMIFFKAFDEHFSNIIKQRYSYHGDEIIVDAKFTQMFRRSDNEEYTILELDKIDDYQKV